MAGYQLVGVLEVVDVAQRQVRTSFTRIIINSVLDIAQSKASRDGGH